MRLVRSWLGVLCATLLLAMPASAQTATTSTISLAAPDASALRSIEAQVARIRGLDQLAEPPLNVLDRTSLHAYLLDQFDKDYLPNERESDQKEWLALGLIKPTDDIVQLQLNLLTDQVIGVYDPQSKGLFVVGDRGTFGPVERMTYAHEFNHALQDQHYDLNRIAPKHPDSSDRSLAVHSIIEGDAIMLQTLWATANLSREDLVQLAGTLDGSDDSLARVPLIMRTELLFPYVEGFSFVRQAFREAGNNYAAVNELFNTPPESTAQVLHWDKYREQVHPVPVQLPDVARSLGPAWRPIGGGVLGELDTRVLLEQWGTDQGEAARVAAGWAGDRWQLVERDGRTAIVLKSKWETPEAAKSFFNAYARGLRQRFDSAMTEESNATRQALTTPVAATDLRLQGSEVLTVIAFDRDTAQAVADLV